VSIQGEPIKNKFGICEWVLPVKGPFSTRLASELGFQGIQLDDLGGYRDGFPLSNKRVQQGYLEEAEKYNVELISLGLNAFAKSGGLKNNRNTPERDSALKALEINIQCCADIGIPILMIPCFWSSFFMSVEENKGPVEILEYACRLAQDKNIIIGLESILSTSELMKLMKNLNYSNFKIFYDTQNPHFFNTAVAAEEIHFFWGKTTLYKFILKTDPRKYRAAAS